MTDLEKLKSVLDELDLYYELEELNPFLEHSKQFKLTLINRWKEECGYCFNSDGSFCLFQQKEKSY
jgi:hypothetical protein